MEIIKHSGVYHFESQQFLPVTKEDAWSFFSAPKNLQIITPEKMQFKITSPLTDDVFQGQIITYNIRLNPLFKMNWVTEITSIESGVSFVDEQRYGPYKMWHHRHVIEEVDGGVLMTDTVHFKLPFPLFSWLVYKPFVKKNLTTIFKYRTDKLDELASKNQIK